MKYLCSKIKWDTDTDGEVPPLPQELIVETEETNDLVSVIGDLLSNETGFCTTGFVHQTPTQVMYDHGYKTLEALQGVIAHCDEPADLIDEYQRDTDVEMTEKAAEILFELGQA